MRNDVALKWYIVHTYSGFENKVKSNLEDRIKTLGQEEYFGKVLVPTEKVVELKKGQKKTSSRKFYPGYIMVQMELSKIIIDEKRQDQVIVLKEKGGDRQFPIVIGFLEASSIKMKLTGVETPRPMTHDLLAAVIKGLDASVERLIIDKLTNNTFHAKLSLKTSGGQVRSVDTRPSDGIAVAVRTQAPIFVEEDVLKKAAIFKLE